MNRTRNERHVHWKAESFGFFLKKVTSGGKLLLPLVQNLGIVKQTTALGLTIHNLKILRFEVLFGFFGF